MSSHSPRDDVPVERTIAKEDIRQLFWPSDLAQRVPTTQFCPGDIEEYRIRNDERCSRDEDDCAGFDYPRVSRRNVHQQYEKTYA